MAMETMTRVNEQMDVAAKKPMAVQPGVARMRELTPAQRRAVMFAQQQVLKAQAAKKAKAAVKKAFQYQLEGKGFSFVEFVSNCPTNWGMTPQKALEWVDTNMIPYYPLGVYKDVKADGFDTIAEAALERAKDCPIANPAPADNAAKGGN